MEPRQEPARIQALPAGEFYAYACERLGDAELARLTKTALGTVTKTWRSRGQFPHVKRLLIERVLLENYPQRPPTAQKDRNSQKNPAPSSRRESAMAKEQQVLWSQVMRVLHDRAKFPRRYAALKNMLDEWVPAEPAPSAARPSVTDRPAK